MTTKTDRGSAIWDAKDLAHSLGMSTRKLNGLINKYDYPEHGRIRKRRSRVSRGSFGYLKPIFDDWWHSVQTKRQAMHAKKFPDGFQEYWESTGMTRGRRVALAAWIAATRRAIVRAID